MKCSFYFSFSLVVAALFSVYNLQAQERSANSASDLQASWTALNTLANSAQQKADVVDARLQNIVKCNLNAKAYAPGASGADGDNCIENAKITDLNTSVDAINALITTMDQKIASLNSGLATMNLSLTSIEGNITTMNSQAANLKSGAADLRAKAADANAKLNDINNKLLYVNTQITDLTNRLSTHTGQIADLYAKLAALNPTLISINTSISSLNNTVNNVNGYVSGLNSGMAGVLSCGSGNYIYNPNVGCVIVPGHASCSMSLVSTRSDFSCGNYIPALLSMQNGTIHSGAGGRGGTDYPATFYTVGCYQISCN